MLLRHRYLLIVSFLLLCPFAIGQYAKASSTGQSSQPQDVAILGKTKSRTMPINVVGHPIDYNNRVSKNNPNENAFNSAGNTVRLGGFRSRWDSFLNDHVMSNNRYLHIQAKHLNQRGLNNAKLFTEYNIHKLEYNKRGQSLLHIPFKNERLFNSISDTIASTKYTVKNERFIGFLRSTVPAFQSVKSFAEAAKGVGQDGNLSTATAGGLSLDDAYNSAIEAIRNSSTIHSVKHIKNRYADLWYLPWGQLGILHKYGSPRIKVPIANDFIIDGKLLKKASNTSLAKLTLDGLIHQEIKHSGSVGSMLQDMYSIHDIKTHCAYFVGANGFFHPRVLDALRNTLHITRRSRFPSYSKWLRLMTAHASKAKHKERLPKITIIFPKSRKHRHIHFKYYKIKHNYYRKHNNSTSQAHLENAIYKQGELDAENDLDSGRDQDSVNLILSHNMMSNPEYVIGFSHYLSDNGNSGSNGDALLNELTAYQQMSDNPEVRYGFEECMDYAGASAPGIVQEHDNDSDFHKGWYLATVYLNDGNVNAANSEPFNQNI